MEKQIGFILLTAIGATYFFGLPAGLIVGVLMLAVTLINSSNHQKKLSSGERKCPHCAEIIKREAKICKHCGKEALMS